MQFAHSWNVQSLEREKERARVCFLSANLYELSDIVYLRLSVCFINFWALFWRIRHVWRQTDENRWAVLWVTWRSTVLFIDQSSFVCVDWRCIANRKDFNEIAFHVNNSQSPRSPRWPGKPIVIHSLSHSLLQKSQSAIYHLENCNTESSREFPLWQMTFMRSSTFSYVDWDHEIIESILLNI